MQQSVQRKPVWEPEGQQREAVQSEDLGQRRDKEPKTKKFY